MRGIAIALSFALGGCLEAQITTCGDLICPPDKVCSPAGDACVTAEQVTSCASLGDGDACDFAQTSGFCHDGVCRAASCGDGVLSGLEECEGEDLGGANCLDANFYLAPGLACTPACTFDVTACQGYCGDGVTNGPEFCDGGAPEGQTCTNHSYDYGRFDCSGLCTPDFRRCGRAGWAPMSSPTTYHLFAASGTAPDDVFAVGLGTFLHYDGASWTELAGSDTLGVVFLNGVWAAAPDDVFIVGEGGRILRWDGTSLTTMASGTTTQLYAVWGTSATDVWAVGQNGKILHDTGGGWVSIPSGTTETLYGVWGSGPSDVYVVGSAGTVLHYTGTWASEDAGVMTKLAAVSGTGPDDVYAVGDMGRIVHRDATGWTPMSSGTMSDLWSVWAIAPGDIDAVGSDGAVLHSDGVGWIGDPSQHGLLRFVWASGRGDVFAGGEFGRLLHHAGTTVDWYGAPDAGLAIWAHAPDDLYTTGYNGVLEHFDGTGWSTIDLGTLNPLHGVWGTAWNDYYVVGNDGIRHYDGTMWTQVSTEANLYSVWGNAWNDVYAVGGVFGDIFHYDGTSWTSVYTTSNYVLGVWSSGPDDVFAVGQDRIHHWNGTAWTSTTVTTTSPDPFLTAVWGSGPDDVFAAGGGTILHYDGSAWTEVFSGWTGFKALWGTGPHDVFAAGDSGTLLHYDGESWTPVRFPFATSLWGASGVGGDLYLVGPDGGTYRLHRDSVTCTGAETLCTNYWDDDCDGLADRDDPDCP